MSHLRYSSVVWWGPLLLAGLALSAAEENSAPLAESKRELKALRSDQALQESESGTRPDAKMRAILPPFKTETESVPAPPPSVDKQKARDEKKKNWLLNGVDALEQDAKIGKRGRGGETGGPRDESDRVDFSDDDYLLSTYEAQKMKTAAAAGDESVGKPSQPFNPLETFLASWMTPDRLGGKKSAWADALKPAAGTAPDRASSGTLNSLLMGTEMATDRITPVRDGTTSTAARNPYLETMMLSATETTTGGGGAGAGMLPPLKADHKSPAATPPDRVIDDRQEPRTDRSYVPPLPDDGKKYFPQLKRF
ncbi:MAG: hypothetical protein PHQ04_11545 [Opitutaceae bacterium]|nr:hypothetical protein [Opitutaceae bacterium]